PVVREARTGEDGCGDAEPLERRYYGRDALVRVVERDVEHPAAAGDRVCGRHRPIAAEPDAAKLPLERVRRHGEEMRPGVRDGVVAEHDRLETFQHPVAT